MKMSAVFIAPIFAFILTVTAQAGEVPKDSDSVTTLKAGAQFIFGKTFELECKRGTFQYATNPFFDRHGVAVVMLDTGSCESDQKVHFLPRDTLIVKQISFYPDDKTSASKSRMTFYVERPDGKSFMMDVYVKSDSDLREATVGDFRRLFDWAFWAQHGD